MAKLKLAFVSGLLLFGAAPLPSSAAEAPVFAEVMYVRPPASLEPAHTNLKRGQLLKEGDRITTMEGGMVRLKLAADGAALQVGPHSDLALKRRAEGIPLLELAHGMLLSFVRPAVTGSKNDKDRFQVKTNKVSMGVRGTSFFVKESLDKPTFLCVCMGKVRTKWQEGEITYESKMHDHHVNINPAKKKAEQQKDMGSDHTDDEIAALKKLL